MRHWKPLLASLLFAAVAAPALSQQAAPAGGLNEAAVPMVMQKAVDDVIRPGYRDMHQSASRLTVAMNGLCSAPSADSLHVARTAFSDTISKWSTIEIVQTGPIIDKNRFEHILFYPDRKGIGMKQVQALIAKADDKDATVEAVASKSVALQSLTALEYVLYGNGWETLSGDKNGFRCRYGAAIAGNIEAVSGQISAEWEDPNGVQKSWKNPGKNSEEFEDSKEAVTALLGILVHGAENVRDQRLESFYKGDVNATHPRMAIYWRSGNTFTSMTANLAGLQALWSKAGMVDLLPSDKREVAAKIDTLLARLIATAPTINADIPLALADDAQRGRIDALLADTRDLTTDFSDGYGAAIGLSAGFSFADGD
jgi:predicted lipoprotein